MFGLTFEKLLIIGLIAVFVIGPERLPQYAAGLARLVKSLRNMATNARDRMREEMGDEFNDINWQDLDPRRYDPRRIIREALLDDPMLPGRSSPPTAPASSPSPSAAPAPAAAVADASQAVANGAVAGSAVGGSAVAGNSIAEAAAKARARNESTPFDSEAT